MARKILSVAALWLALAALAVMSADRDAYTWTFEGEVLSQVLVSTRQARENEDGARQAMALEKEHARERAGMWDQTAQYGGAAQTRSAVDETLGLNLMWGEYAVTVSYASPREIFLRVVSPLMGTFIEGGEKTLPAMDGAASFSFTLTDACPQVTVAVDVPVDAQIHSVTVRKTDGVLSDAMAYALLAGVVLTALLALSWDKSPKGPERRRDALALFSVALFASMPVLFSGIYDGHDLFFHLNRIEGIAAGLRAGQLPVRIHASTLLGYGYAAPQFYPELFLYLPAVLRNLGVSLAGSVRIFEMTVNLATALVCYANARGIFGERRMALGASALYTLCSYRLASLYVRAALGEALAMIFFPLLVYAMAEVLTGDERRWPLLAASMTGIFMSHLLSTLFAAALCLLAALVCAGRLLREPRRILACAKAALLTAVCSAWFLVPFLDFARAGINTSVALAAGDHVLHPGAFFVGFPGLRLDLPYEATDFAYTVGVVPGLALMLGCALALARLYMRGAEKREDRLCRVFLALSGLLLLGTMALFPWSWACGLPRPYSTLFQQMQYPWRLVSVAAPMMAFAAAWGFLRGEARRTQALAAVLALCMVFSGYSMQAFVQDAPLLEKDGFCDTRIEQYEYIYEGTEKGALVPGEVVALDAPVFAVRDYSKRGTSLRFTLNAPQGLSSLEAPLLYYPGYRATANGAECRVAKGDNNVIRLYGVPGGENVEIAVWYEAPPAWNIACAASLLGAALLLALLFRRNRGRRA